MSRQVTTLRIDRIPISRLVWLGLVGLILFCIPTALLAGPASTPAVYYGAPTVLPIPAASNYLLEDISVDAAGTVYVLDANNNQVYVESQDYLGLASVSGGAGNGPSGYPGNSAGTITCSNLSSAGTSGRGLWGPKAFAITGAGTMYIADSGNGRLVSVNLSSPSTCAVVLGTTASIPASDGNSYGLSYPQGVAVSEYGDIYISDYNAGPGGHGMIVRIPNGGAAYAVLDENTTIAGNTWTCPALLPCGYQYSSPVVVNGIWNPGHLAWDNYDDMLFIADYGNSRILAFNEQWVSGGGGLPWEIETSGAWNWPQNLPGSNSQRPQGMAVDSVGNLYWTDDSTSQAYELPHPANGNWNSTNYPLTTGNQSLTGALANANGIFVDQWGTVYVVDTGVGPGPTTGHDRVLVNVSKGNGTAGLGPVNFHNLPLNLNKTEWQQLAFNVSSGVTVAAATAYTEGTEFLDFAISNNSSPTCTTGFTGPAICYLWVSFKPTAPGLRRGAVVLYNSAGQQIANVPVFGTGTAPELEFFPTGYGAAIPTGSVATVQPMQIALDGNNNMYVADYTGNSLVEVPPAGGNAQVISLSGSSGASPVQAAGVAVDGAGDVFIADHQGSAIWVTNPAVSSGYTQLAIDGLSTPISEPMELNFDPAGNLYIADWGNSRVVEVSGIFINSSNLFEGRGTVIMTNGTYLGQGYAFPSVSLGTTGKSVTGVAVDPMMNVYITDSVPGNIVTAPQSLNQIAPGYLTTGRLNWPYSNNGFSGVQGVFKLPQGLTTDGMGNLYVADAGNSRIVAGNFQTEFGNRSTGFGITVASNVATPGPLGNNLFGVAVDPWGNVFVPDYANNRIAAYYPTTPPTENFASTYVGITSADSPKTARLWNIGNEMLTFLAPATGLNPSISTNFTYGAGSTCPQIGSSGSFTLGRAAGCTIVDSFLPLAAGAITGNVIATDNNLYPAGWTNSTIVNTTQAIPLTGTGLQDVPVSVVLTGTPNPVFMLNVVTYTATVTGVTGAGTPTGTVTFFDGLTTLGTATLNASGVATLQAAPQNVTATTQYISGTHSITAVYNGSSIYTTATSNTLALVVQDFTFSVPNPASAIVNPSGTAIFNVTLTPVNGTTFPAAITLTTSGAPTGSSVTLSPTTILSGGSATNLIVTVVAPQITHASSQQPESLGRRLAPISFALLLLPLLGIGRGRKIWQRYLAVLILLVGGLAATTALSGCSNTPSGYFGQGTTYDYTVTVTATSGGLSHSASFLLTVN